VLCVRWTNISKSSTEAISIQVFESPKEVARALVGSGATSNRKTLIKDALSAAPALIAKTATVKDWDGTVLKQGNDDFTRFPTPASKRSKGEKEPMCLDKLWLTSNPFGRLSKLHVYFHSAPNEPEIAVG